MALVFVAHEREVGRGRGRERKEGKERKEGWTVKGVSGRKDCTGMKV